jgi:hypothetical protein
MRLWPIVGFVMLGLATIFGCGDDGAAMVDGSAPATVEKQASAPQAAGRCQCQVGGFIESLDGLRRRLAVGLTYKYYIDEVRDLKRTYADVPVDRLAVGCLLAVAAPGEQALNEYIDAVNTWGDCLAVASCDTESVEPKLQHRWAFASDHLSLADDGLRAARR